MAATGRWKAVGFGNQERLKLESRRPGAGEAFFLAFPEIELEIARNYL